ncbi:LOW QUALITY PROTEIN: hypothetical protein RJ639_046336 [Escallonia herrerae]|uniref:Nudix hydrolase domain-containing protein n=1 Tax=Escallonia herrerae TaxID=1293975 RepID=A0AA88W7D3_9ASTE|nr:LOW QUALITY PROTEIN: hypothetical protein RJ639_046336 [Escallonia herrerae]
MSSEAHSSLVEKPVVPENRIQHIDLLNASEDAYEGVNVEMKEPMDSNVFVSLLRASISQWRQKCAKMALKNNIMCPNHVGQEGVWLKLPIELVNLVEAAVKLVYWIPKTTHTIPANASHRVGIGAFVMNNKGEVLVVQEKGGKFGGTGVWKLPTGVVDELSNLFLGEDICVAAIREVKEEARIATEFVEVLAFRQSHKSFYGKSDLFFVYAKTTLCRYPEAKLGDHCSTDCEKPSCWFNGSNSYHLFNRGQQWMPIEEYAAQPFVQKHSGFSYIVRICLAKKDNRHSAVPTSRGFSAITSFLYFNDAKDLELKHRIFQLLYLLGFLLTVVEQQGGTDPSLPACAYGDERRMTFTKLRNGAVPVLNTEDQDQLLVIGGRPPLCRLPAYCATVWDSAKPRGRFGDSRKSGGGLGIENGEDGRIGDGIKVNQIGRWAFVVDGDGVVELLFVRQRSTHRLHLPLCRLLTLGLRIYHFLLTAELSK